MLSFGLWYDFRNPAGKPSAPFYAELLQQIEDVEALGYDHVWTTEHHFVEDGYSPSLMPLCAAIASRTRRIRIGTAVLLLPFHDPVRLAEDAATVDILSGGRLDLGVGLGYRQGEYESFRVDFKSRGRRMNEAAEILGRALAGEVFDFDGEFYSYSKVQVTPGPVQTPTPLWFGGLSKPAARRAARLGTGFIAGAGPNVVPAYEAECGRLGKRMGPVCKGLGFVAIAEDVERAWQMVREPLFYQRCLYAEWLNEAGTTNVWPVPESPEDIRAGEPDLVVTPQRAVELVSQLSADPLITHVYWHPIPPGLAPELAWPSIELFANKVISQFR